MMIAGSKRFWLLLHLAIPAIIVSCKPERDYWLMAKSEFSDKDYLGAIIELNCLLETDSLNDSALVLRAGSFHKIGKDEKALQDLKTAVEINPSNSQARLENARLIAADNPYSALLLLQGITEKTGRIASDALIEQGRIHYFADRFSESLNDFTAAIDADSSYALAWYYRGLMRSSFFDRDGSSGKKIFAFFDFDKSLFDFTKAVELQPDFADAWFQRAMVYFNMFDGVNGLKDANKAIALEPAYSYYYLGRAHYYRENAERTKALNDYNKAISLFDKDPNAYEERAVLYDSLGKTDLANKDRKTAFELKAQQEMDKKK